MKHDNTTPRRTRRAGASFRRVLRPSAAAILWLTVPGVVRAASPTLALTVVALPNATSAAPTETEIRLLPPTYFESARLELRGTPQFSQVGPELKMRLANGFEIRFDTQDIRLTITSATGVCVAANRPGKVIDGLDYVPRGVGPDVKPYPAELKLTFKKAKTLGESVTLEFGVRSQDGKESLLSWTILPVRYRINGAVYDGVADQFEIMDKHHHLHKLFLSWLGPMGDSYDGARSFRFSCYPGNRQAYSEAHFGRTRPRQSLADWGMFIDGGQLFHLIGLPQGKGCIFEYLDEPIHCRSGMRSNPSNTAIETYYMIYLGRVTNTYTTPLRIRLLTSRSLSRSLWVELARRMKRKFQQDLGIPPTEPRPVACLRNEWRKTGFEKHAADLIPILKEYGYRRVEIGWIWRRGRTHGSQEAYPVLSEWTGKKLVRKRHCQTDINGTVTSDCGGLRGLAEFVKRAHEAGVEVYVWHQTAHTWQGSPDVRNHPEWLVYGLDGHSVSGWNDDHDVVPVVWLSLRSGWKDETIRRLRDLRRATKIDGLWLDVYGAGSTCNYLEPVSAYCMADRSDYIRTLRELGYGLMTEGASLACIDSYVIYDRDLESYRRHPFILYGACPFRTGKAIEHGQLDLFKLMSYQAFPQDRANVWRVPDDPEKRKTQQAYAAEVKYRNRCFNEIRDQLGRVVGVTETPFGTQWVCEKGNALFLWESCEPRLVSSEPMHPATILSPGTSAAKISPPHHKQEWRIKAPRRSVVLLRRR